MFGLFEKIPIALRFFIIGLLFTLFFLQHILFDLTRELNQEKENLSMRLSGLGYLKSTNDQIDALQEIRGLGNIYLQGNETVLDEITQLRSNALKNFAWFETLVHPYDSHTYHDKLNKIRHEFDTLGERFETYRSRPASPGEAAAMFNAYSDLIEQLLNFNAYIAVIHNIGEHSDWELFILSELLAERLPVAIELLSRLRGIASGNIQLGHVTSDEMERLQFNIRLFKHNRDIIYDKLTQIFSYDAELKRSLAPALEKAVKANRELIGNLEYYLFTPGVKMVDAKTFFAMATDNMLSTKHFFSIVQETLTHEIKQHASMRMDYLRFRIYLESATLIAGLLLFWLFYRSSMGYIRKIENAERAKVSFLSQVSHEIRTPLNAIIGFIKLLREKVTDTENRQYVDTIEKSSYLLLDIINDVLDLNKINSGKLSIESIPFNPHREFEHLIALHTAKADEKAITFHTRFDPSLPKCISSDPLRLKQIIGNLLSNAIKFTPENGEVALDIGFDKSRNRLNVSVHDSGIGIPLSRQQNVFDAFTQAEKSTTREYGGTGLGLTICSKLVSMLRGKLKLESSVGEGSKFSFVIPLDPCGSRTTDISKEKWSEVEKTLQPSKPKRFKGNVLVVEDNETNQMYMQIILEQLGLAYEIAEDGLEAVELFKTGHFDIILMDENMPRMNGLEAAHIILQTERERNLPHTPLIAITANALIGDREHFLSSGMDDYLSKPVEKETLTALFERYLAKEKSNDETDKMVLPPTSNSQTRGV